MPDAGPKPLEDVFFSWYIIVTSYMDLGKGSSAPGIRPFYVLGAGSGGAGRFPPSRSFPEAFVLRQFDTWTLAVLVVPEGA